MASLNTNGLHSLTLLNKNASAAFINTSTSVLSPHIVTLSGTPSFVNGCQYSIKLPAWLPMKWNSTLGSFLANANPSPWFFPGVHSPTLITCFLLLSIPNCHLASSFCAADGICGSIGNCITSLYPGTSNVSKW